MLDEYNYEEYILQINLIEVDFFITLSQSTLRFKTIIYHDLNYYQTSYLPVDNQKLNLTATQIFTINHRIQPRKRQQNRILFQITVNDYQSQLKYYSSVDENALFSVLAMDKKFEGRRRQKLKHILSFPLFGSQRQQIGQIKFNMLVINKKINLQKIIETQKQIRKQKSSDKFRKLVFSKNSQSYFQPSVSRSIFVKIDSDEEQIQNESQKSQKQLLKQKQINQECLQKHDMSQDNHQAKTNHKDQKGESFQPFKQEQISLIEMKDSNEGKLMTEQELREMDVCSQPFQQNLRQGRILKSKEQEQKSDNQEEVPEDYKHLFLKINQINRKYAPLERISSQQQFSQDCASLSNNHNISQDSLRASSEIDTQQISSHLADAQKLLKQLNLYKFGQHLQQIKHQSIKT